MAGYIGDTLRKRGVLSAADQPIAMADQYRKALERSAYGDFGRQYGAGLNDITSYLARSGPLADSGAATALRARLASQLYGQAQSRIQGGYADYLRQLQLQRLSYQQQLALLKQQKKMQSGGFWGTVGGIAGAALPALL